MDSELDSGGENPVDIANLVLVSAPKWSLLFVKSRSLGSELRISEGSIN